MLWTKTPYTGKPIAKERVIVWTQEQTPHNRNGEWHPQSYPNSHLERGCISQLTQQSQGEVAPLSTLTMVAKKDCTSVSPHSSHQERPHHCQPSQQLKGPHPTHSSQQEEGPYPKGSPQQEERGLHPNHITAESGGAATYTPHSKGEG